MCRLPLGDLSLADTSALSSLPGQQPTQDAIGSADRNVAAFGPTSANDLKCRIRTQPRYFGQPAHCVLVLMQCLGGGFLNSVDLTIQQFQPFQKQFQDSALQCRKSRRRPQCVLQFLLGGPQPLHGQFGYPPRIGLAFGQRLQHAPGTETQQIAYVTG